MPPQGYYGTAKTRRKKKKPGYSVTSGALVGARAGRPGSRTRRPARQTVQRPGADRISNPVAPPTAAGTIAPVETALTGGTGGYDLGTDPAVAAAAGLAAKQRAMAQATALARRKQAAIEYGDPSGIAGIDEETQRAARENPFSILKNVDRSYETGTRELEEGLNAANLFYSGYRGQQLAEAARGYQQTKYDAANAFRGLMTDVDSSLAEALMNADMYEASSIMDSDGGDYDPGYDPGGNDDNMAYSLVGGGKVARGLGPRSGPLDYGRTTKKKKKPPRRRNSYGAGGARPLAM